MWSFTIFPDGSRSAVGGLLGATIGEHELALRLVQASHGMIGNRILIRARPIGGSQVAGGKIKRGCQNCGRPTGVRAHCQQITGCLGCDEPIIECVVLDRNRRARVLIEEGNGMIQSAD